MRKHLTGAEIGDRNLYGGDGLGPIAATVRYGVLKISVGATIPEDNALRKNTI